MSKEDSKNLCLVHMRFFLVVFMALILLRDFPTSNRFSYLLLFNSYRYKNEENVTGVGLR